MKYKRHKRIDADGVSLSKGDIVRIVGVPEMDPNYPKDSLEVFEYLVGKYKRIENFNKYGDVEFNFKILKGPHEGYHWVSIEPFLLKKKKEGHLTRRCS